MKVATISLAYGSGLFYANKLKNHFISGKILRKSEKVKFILVIFGVLFNIQT